MKIPGLLNRVNEKMSVLTRLQQRLTWLNVHWRQASEPAPYDWSARQHQNNRLSVNASLATKRGARTQKRKSLKVS